MRAAAFVKSMKPSGNVQCVFFILAICPSKPDVIDYCVSGDLSCGARDMHNSRLVKVTTGLDPDGHGPFDCHGNGCEATGIGCHSECECRHLDNIEKIRFSAAGWHYPSKPSLVICASRDGRGVASTWAFNAVRLLFRQAREAADSYWIRTLTKKKLQHRLQTGAHLVVKTHEWAPHISISDFEDIKALFTRVIVSTRAGREDDPAWMSVATMTVAFEDDD
eukprot:gnl/MRDRNA2_/MRDRNA2_71245_c0_seq1.p1 gnl/MRDRNA2_/MRDRNA2_71245_c0~~gnl/MRDRNA2_/MRDRNA2_71245_c0_seq1.p1  ORF type:complete len:221 (+),score=22.48 gnl/MRDRNA2_/MRDRNA2_71245_c0_seq1:134-796(+)